MVLGRVAKRTVVSGAKQLLSSRVDPQTPLMFPEDLVLPRHGVDTWRTTPHTIRSPIGAIGFSGILGPGMLLAVSPKDSESEQTAFFNALNFAGGPVTRRAAWQHDYPNVCVLSPGDVLPMGGDYQDSAIVSAFQVGWRNAVILAADGYAGPVLDSRPVARVWHKMVAPPASTAWVRGVSRLAGTIQASGVAYGATPATPGLVDIPHGSRWVTMCFHDDGAEPTVDLDVAISWLATEAGEWLNHPDDQCVVAGRGQIGAGHTVETFEIPSSAHNLWISGTVAAGTVSHFDAIFGW